MSGLFHADYVDLNVVILPERSLSLKLIRWSKLVGSKFKTNYVLDNVKCLPHLSLYSARYPVKNKQLAEEAVSNIAKVLHPFKITLRGFSCFSGYFFYDADKSKELVRLQEKIVDKLNPLREGLITDNQKQLKGLSLDQKKAIEEFGYVSVKNLYMPHISITHLANPLEGNLVKEMLPKEASSFLAENLAISRFAEYGTFPKPFIKYLVGWRNFIVSK